MDYARSPGLLIVSDGDVPDIGDTRVLAVVPIAEALDAIAGRSFDALLIVAESESPALIDLLVRIDAEGAPAILSLAPALLDLGWSLAPDACLLSEPTPGELAAAIAPALAPTDAIVAERRDNPAELLRLSAEVGRIAQALAELSAEPAPASAPDAAQVRAVLRARRLRDRFLDGALFADPAWDMMLDLYAARIEGRPVAVSSLCIAAAVPTTTALRWIRTLTDAGLFARVADPEDGRRFFIALSDTVRDAITAYFAELRRSGLPILT